MPWLYNVTGNSTPPTANDYHWYGLNTSNQEAALLNLPACAISKIRVYASARSSSVLTRLAVWQSNGTIVADTNTFTMTPGSESVGGQAWQEVSYVTPQYVGAGNYFVGLYRNPSGAHIGGTHTSIDSYLKTNTAGFPAVVTMNGYSADTDEGLLAGVFYITAPVAPSSASATRNSDNSITINFTNNSSADAPYSYIIIRRYDEYTGNWYDIATTSSSATSYTDTTVSANGIYKYRVLAINQVATSSYSETDYIYTTPNAPSNVVASRSGSNVILSWVNETWTDATVEIAKRESLDGGATWEAWDYESIPDQPATSESYTDTSPYSYGQYAIRSKSYLGGLYSSWIYSNDAVTLQAPSAPTNLSPDNTYFDATASKQFTWQHNPLDGSTQTKYSIQYKVSGGAYPGTPQINENVSGTSSHTFAGATFTNGTTYKYQVKTWGAYSTGSDWSTEKTFYCAAIPVGTITSPTVVTDYALSALTMTWSFTGALQIEFLAKLYDSNDVLLETQSAGSSAETVNFTTLLLNGCGYTVTLQVKDSTGLWSEETSVEFNTVFAVPPTPTFTLTANEINGSVSIAITNPSPEGEEIEAISNNIYRSIDGINYYLILENVALNTNVTDYIPILGSATHYVVEAVSAAPTVAQATSQNTTVTCFGLYFINSGSNYLTYVILSQETEVTDKVERETVLNQFEGRSYPVKYQSDLLNQEISFSCDILVADLASVKAIVQTADDLFFRDHSGRWFDCAIINPNFVKQENGRVYNFKCTIIQIEME